MYSVTDTTWNQTSVFFGCMFTGIVLGLVFDIINGEKQYIDKKILKIVQDVLFCITVFFLVAATLYMLNNGKIEIYIVLSIFVGFWVGQKMFEKPVNTLIKSRKQLIKFIIIRLNKFKT